MEAKTLQLTKDLKEESESYTMSDWLSSVYADEKYEPTEMGKYAALLTKGERTRIGKVIDLSVQRQKNNYDVIPVVSGFEGSGKSSLAWWLIKGIMKRNGLPFDMETNIFFHQEGVDQYEMLKRRIASLPRRGALSIDEAIKTMYSRNWNKKQQKDLNITFTTIRKQNLFVPLCIPSLAELDTFFKNFRVLFWIHIFVRGKAGLFVKDPNPFNPDPFNLKQSKKIIEDNLKRERFDVDTLIQTLHEHVPNFITWFNYKQMPAKDEKEYDRLTQLYNVEKAKEEESTKDKYDKLQEESIAIMFESSPTWTIQKLAIRFKMSERKVRKIINKARGITEVAPMTTEPRKVDDINGVEQT